MSEFLDRTGIKLTNKANPIAEGKIQLFRENLQLNDQEHEAVLLNFVKLDRNRDVSISLGQYSGEIDKTSHLYPDPEKPIDGKVVYFFPKPVIQFLLDHMGGFKPNLEESLCLRSDQTIETKSYNIGSVIFNIPNTADYIDLNVVESSFFIKQSAYGMNVRISLELLNRGKIFNDKLSSDSEYDINTHYRMEIDFFLSNSLIDFRFLQKIQIADQQRYTKQPASLYQATSLYP